MTILNVLYKSAEVTYGIDTVSNPDYGNENEKYRKYSIGAASVGALGAIPFLTTKSQQGYDDDINEVKRNINNKRKFIREKVNRLNESITKINPNISSEEFNAITVKKDENELRKLYNHLSRKKRRKTSFNDFKENMFGRIDNTKQLRKSIANEIYNHRTKINDIKRAKEKAPLKRKIGAGLMGAGALGALYFAHKDSDNV